MYNNATANYTGKMPTRANAASRMTVPAFGIAAETKNMCGGVLYWYFDFLS